MKYKVIDMRTGEDVTDRMSWVLRPDGKVGYIGELTFTVCTDVLAIPFVEDWNEV